VKLNLNSKTTGIVILLSILIIGESVWLVNRLNKSASQEGKMEEKTVVEEIAPFVRLTLDGPQQVKAGEKFQVILGLQAEENFTADGMDLILNYNPKMLKVMNVGVDQTLFKTVGRNLVEPEKERIVVSLLNLETGAESGVEVSKGAEDQLLTITFTALTSGNTQVLLEVPQVTTSTGTKIIEARTGGQLPFAKEDLSVVILK